MPVNTCVVCGAQHYSIFRKWKGCCSIRCWDDRQLTFNRKHRVINETARRMMQAKTGPRRLLRDLDGYIHTPSGFVSARRYDDLRAKFPEREFPERSTIPLMSDLSDSDLEQWYGGEVAREVLLLRTNGELKAGK